MLSSLKELLIKKALNRSHLVSELESMPSNLFLDAVLESLEKMSKRIDSAGRNPNKAVNNLASNIASTHVSGQPHETVELIRDALAHHISQHKANLKAGFRQAADAHLNKIVPLMHLVAKLGNRVPDAIGLRAVDTRPWEVNYRTPLTRGEALERGLRGPIREGADPNEFHNETQGLKARPSKSVRSDWSNLKDYRYLEMRPHPHKSMWSPKINKEPWDTEGYEGGYPFEEVRVAGEKELENGGGFLPIKNVEPSNNYKPHALDYHPISHMMDIESDKLTPEQENDYANAASVWHEHPEYQKWLESFVNSLDQDPDSLTKISRNKPPHHYEGIDLTEHPPHAKIFIDRWGKEATGQPTTRQTAEPEKETTQSGDINWDLLPENLRSKHKPINETQQQKKSTKEQASNMDSDINWDLLPEALKAKHKK